ncbi:MAG TPA: hypothetical protein VM143_09075 [Acidimicrobiales bacterium]|nr:hypothetical protein [Acidimicrobiales bacterium]
MPTFRIARNPDVDSSLPFLLWVPVGTRPLVLKAKDTWPRTAKVHCHRAEWPDDAEVIEEVASGPASVGAWPLTSSSTGCERAAHSS